MHVLIVDDDEIDRKNLRRLLSKNRSITITEAPEPDDALNSVEKKVFDAVILDYHLPKQNGLELFSQMKNQQGFDESSVLFVSNSEDEHIAEKCIECGAHDFMLKSDLNESRLRRAIMLARKRRELENYVRRSYAKIKYLAERDSLTGLLNRSSFESELEFFCENKFSFQSFYLVLVDADGFASFNDTYGSRMGDQLIMETASRLKEYFKEGAYIGRVGNDEFAILLSEKADIDNIHSCLWLLNGKLSQRIHTGKVITSSSFSMGVSSLITDTCPPEKVIKQARIALDSCRNQWNESLVLFDESLLEGQNKLERIQRGIEYHLAKSDFVMAYQPIYESNEQIVGVEALVRWPDKSKFGYHAPGIFIPEAERTHQIIALGNWIAHTAIRQFAELSGVCGKSLFLSLNISPVQLDVRDICDVLCGYCAQFGIHTSQVILEVTESALMKRHIDTATQLQRLVSAGFKIALDDFGTGYSSISHILDFPIAILKSDRSVLPRQPGDQKRKTVLESLVKMGNSLGVTTVVEGVEQQWQVDYCKQLGTHRLQGYFYSKPLKFEQLLAFFE